MQDHSILEMLDAVERGIAALQSRFAPRGKPSPSGGEAVATLLNELKGAGLSAMPSARRELLNGQGAYQAQRPNSHPFSRIEEL